MDYLHLWCSRFVLREIRFPAEDPPPLVRESALSSLGIYWPFCLSNVGTSTFVRNLTHTWFCHWVLFFFDLGDQLFYFSVWSECRLYLKSLQDSSPLFSSGSKEGDLHFFMVFAIFNFHKILNEAIRINLGSQMLIIRLYDFL